MPAVGDAGALADFEQYWAAARASGGLDLSDELESDLAHRARSRARLSETDLGWLAASWLARRALPIWFELLGQIGPAHSLISTPPVRGADSSLLSVAVEVKRARRHVEGALDELLGAPAWRGPQEPVAAAVEVEADYALVRSGSLTCAALAEAAGPKAVGIAQMALDAARQTIRLAGHFLAEQTLAERGSLEPAVLSAIQQGVRAEVYIPMTRLERVAKVIFMPAADAAEPHAGSRPTSRAGQRSRRGTPQR